MLINQSKDIDCYLKPLIPEWILYHFIMHNITDKKVLSIQKRTMKTVFHSEYHKCINVNHSMCVSVNLPSDRQSRQLWCINCQKCMVVKLTSYVFY